MSKTRFGIGKVFGVPIYIDASWLLIFLWVTWSLASSYLPRLYPSWSPVLTWSMGILASLLFFGGVLLHELGHAFVAKQSGNPVQDITLFLFGGAAVISDEPQTPLDEAKVALAGPLVSLALSGTFAALHIALRDVSQPAAALSLFLGGTNLSLGLFNLLPGFPLDGGRVLRALLWRLRKDLAWATRWASRAGQAVAFGFVAYGIMRSFAGTWVDGIWMVFIGLFLDSAARSQYRQLTLRNLLGGYAVRNIMARECDLIPPQLTLDVLVEQYLLSRARRCYAVGQGDTIMGLLTVHNVSAVDKVDWPFTRVSQVYTPLAQLRTLSPDASLWHALQHMTSSGVNQLPVVVGDQFQGMLTREDVLTFMRNRSQLGAS